MAFQFILPDHPQRKIVEGFICQRYWLHFNACLSHLPERLLAVFEPSQENQHECSESIVVAACGIQLAEESALFSEYYLPEALERLFAGTYQRNDFAEVGSLAVADARYLIELFNAVREAAQSLQRQQLVFTITRFLQVKLQRLGIQVQQLAEAHEHCLPQTMQGLWGNYYQQQPRVIVADVTQAWPQPRSCQYPPKAATAQVLVC